MSRVTKMINTEEEVFSHKVCDVCGNKSESELRFGEGWVHVSEHYNEPGSKFLFSIELDLCSGACWLIALGQTLEKSKGWSEGEHREKIFGLSYRCATEVFELFNISNALRGIGSVREEAKTDG